MAVKCMSKFLVNLKIGPRNPKHTTQPVRNRWWSSTPIRTNTSYKVVLPANVTKQIAYDMIPQHVSLPPYAKTGIPPPIRQQVCTNHGQFWVDVISSSKGEGDPVVYSAIEPNFVYDLRNQKLNHLKI